MQLKLSSRDAGATVAELLACSPPTKAIRVQSLARCSHVGIVPDDAVGQRVFSGISRFPLPFIPALLRTRTWFSLAGGEKPSRYANRGPGSRNVTLALGSLCRVYRPFTVISYSSEALLKGRIVLVSGATCGEKYDRPPAALGVIWERACRHSQERVPPPGLTLDPRWTVSAQRRVSRPSLVRSWIRALVTVALTSHLTFTQYGWVRLDVSSTWSSETVPAAQERAMAYSNGQSLHLPGAISENLGCYTVNSQYRIEANEMNLIREVKRGEYGAAPEWKGKGNGRPPRKPTDQQHRLALFAHCESGIDSVGNRTRRLLRIKEASDVLQLPHWMRLQIHELQPLEWKSTPDIQSALGIYASHEIASRRRGAKDSFHDMLYVNDSFHDMLYVNGAQQLRVRCSIPINDSEKHFYPLRIRISGVVFRSQQDFLWEQERCWMTKVKQNYHLATALLLHLTLPAQHSPQGNTEKHVTRSEGSVQLAAFYAQVYIFFIQTQLAEKGGGGVYAAGRKIPQGHALKKIYTRSREKERGEL
ncbi:hypothetical protein PR048_005810 [Dryococelus australis]|uniref:Uncharacterized protein n=1 Tax=Dryococelus australis TaxID=614101 RepID=A0ABQ9I974_9NEOP|nr:hypothetical protein PR048_005810 [Dryococelus australis]